MARSLSLFLFFLPAFVAGTGGLLANAAAAQSVEASSAKAKTDASSIAATVEHMIKDAGLTLKGDVTDLVKNLMTQNLNPGTLRGMLLSLFGEIPDDQQEAFTSLASKLTGLYAKKNKLMKEMVDTFANGTADAEKLRTFMRTMNVNAIITEVNRTFGGQKEWKRIKNFISEMNKGKKNDEKKPEEEEPEVQIDEIMPETGGFDPLPPVDQPDTSLVDPNPSMSIQIEPIEDGNNAQLHSDAALVDPIPSMSIQIDPPVHGGNVQHGVSLVDPKPSMSIQIEPPVEDSNVQGGLQAHPSNLPKFAPIGF